MSDQEASSYGKKCTCNCGASQKLDEIYADMVQREKEHHSLVFVETVKRMIRK